MTDTEIVEQRGEYRATIQYDHYPSEPDFEVGCPILRVDEWNRVTPTGYGSLSAKGDGIPGGGAWALAYFLRENGNTSDAVDVFDRWLRIWHGGGAVGYNLGISREYGYVAYLTRLMVINVWGNEPEYVDANPDIFVPELAEWQAYCEGEVFLVEVERKVLAVTGTLSLDRDVLRPLSEHEEWVTEDGPVGGYYGEDYAREAAVEMLSAYAPKVCDHCGTALVAEDCPNYGTGEVHA